MAKAVHKSGLGRGLADLFAEERFSEQEQDSQSILKLAMELVEPNQEQPRKAFDAELMQQLTESIRMHGVVTPITVRKSSHGSYQIIAGERRWRAARDAGLTEIPAMILDVSDEEVMEIALIENLQRQDLNAIEEAEGYETLVKQYGLTQDQVAERVGKSRSAVANSLRLLSLQSVARELVIQGKISGGHARAVLSIHDESKRAEAAQKMEGLSVRQAELLAKRLNSAPKQQQEEKQEEVNYLSELERQLESRLGRRVRIEITKTHGTLSLEFYGNEDLERLREALEELHV